MIEEVKKVRREPQLQAVRQTEVLEQGDIRIPGAWTEEKGARIRIHRIGDRREAQGPVAQGLRQAVVKSSAEGTHNPRSPVDRHQRLQFLQIHIGGSARVKVAAEIEP